MFILAGTSLAIKVGLEATARETEGEWEVLGSQVSSSIFLCVYLLLEKVSAKSFIYCSKCIAPHLGNVFYS